MVWGEPSGHEQRSAWRYARRHNQTELDQGAWIAEQDWSTPESRAGGELLGYLRGQIGKPLADFNDPNAPWRSWANRAYRGYRRGAERQFSERTIPALREQFSGAGALHGGIRHRAEQEAGAGLAAHLSATRYQIERQAFDDYVRTRPQMNPALAQLLGALNLMEPDTIINQDQGTDLSWLGGLFGAAGTVGAALVAPPAAPVVIPAALAAAGVTAAQSGRSSSSRSSGSTGGGYYPGYGGGYGSGYGTGTAATNIR